MVHDDVVQDPRVEEVILTESGEALPSVPLLMGDRRDWAELRTAYEDAYHAGNPIARCAACHRPVKPRMSPDKRRYFWHFHKNAQCPYQGKTGPNRRILDAMRYNGQKEGPEHRRIKKLLVNSLKADRIFDQESLAIEQRWWGVTDEGKWRTPDVSIIRDGTRVAFEVQLSTTYLGVMRERHRFYLDNDGLLFWIFRQAETVDPRQMQDDIFYWNNSNLFVVDDETCRLSTEQGALVLRCHYLEPQLDAPEVWREQLVRYNELTIDVSAQRAFYYDNEAARRDIDERKATQEQADLRERFIALWTRPGAGNGEEFRADYAKLARELATAGIKVPADVTDDVKRFTWICLSAAAGKGVGFGHTTILEVANYAFANCAQLVHYLLAAARRAGTTQLLLEQDEAAGARRKRLGKPHDPWRERTPRFRESYLLSQSQKAGAFSIDRSFDSLYELLFPTGGVKG